MPEEDEELVNEGMYGKALAKYLQRELALNGYHTPSISCEDWGWWITVAGLPYSCGIGVYGRRMEDREDLDLCVTVLTPRGKRWSWTRFRFMDTTMEVDRLHLTLRQICSVDKDIHVIAESFDFPFP